LDLILSGFRAALASTWRFLRRPSSLAALGAALVVGALSYYGEDQNNQLHQQRARSEVQDQLGVIRARLEGLISSNTRLVQGLVAVIATEPEMDQVRFAALSRELFKTHNELRSVAGARDLVVNLLYPFEENVRAFGLDYRQNEAQREAALRARNSGKMVFAGPVSLVQGGTAFIARYPVSIGEGTGAQFWGLVSAVIDAERLYQSAGLYDPDLPLRIAITGVDARGGDNRVFFGDATLPNPQAVIGEVLVPNGMWLLHAEPKDGWSHEAPYAPVLRLAFLLLGATLIFPILVGGQMGEERKRHMRAVAVRETELRRLSRRLGMALQASHIGVWENDINTGMLNWDDRINCMYGLPQDGGARTYTDWRNAVHPEDRERAEEEFREAVQETGQYASEFRIIRQTDGAVRHIRAIGAVYDDLGATPKIAGVNLDVTEDVHLNYSLTEAYRITEARNAALAEAKASIEYNALHDSLTGLPNRRYLDDMLRRFADPALLEGGKLALLHIDLDRFKQINDTLGHAAGDAMLVHAAHVLQSNVRPEDFVARIGGDEFVIVCVVKDEAMLSGLADRIIATMRQPVPYDGHECRFGVSVGIASGAGDAVDPAKLLVNADIALYKAKSNGRSRFEYFTPSLQSEVIKTKRLADHILQGLDRHEFEPWFQFQFDAKTLDVVGCEALARWRHPTDGVVAPDTFLAVAEELNVVATIDRIILEQSLTARAGWLAQGLVVPRVSVNVSARRLRDEQLLSGLRSLDIQPGTVSFELVESIFLDKTDDLVHFHVEQLKELGIDIEIDDFGTGYASIVSLLQLKPKRLKIDRQLVIPVLSSSAQRRLVDSVIDIGKSLDIEVVCEGVETMEHAKVLRDLGCDILQGYALARPMPASQVPAFLRSQPWRAADGAFGGKAAVWAGRR
jgi:diguanylate cyclase (GGDEF)-like protein